MVFKKLLSFGLFLFLVNTVFALATVNVHPSIVNIGEKLTIEINPDSNGVRDYMHLYGPFNNYLTSLRLNCTNSICDSHITLDYFIPTSFSNGTYHLIAYPIGSLGNSSENLSSNIITYFEVTGSSVYDFEALISADPLFAAPNSQITLSITPGSKGISKYLYFYNSRGASILSYNLNCSTTSYCYSPIIQTFVIPSSWLNGNYSARIYDYLTRTSKSAYFEVFGSSARETIAKLIPEEISPGKTLKIFVSPGSNGISSYAYIYDSSGKLKQSLNFNCAGGKCFNNISYNYAIPNFLNGIYTLNIYDYNNYNYLKYNFKVVNSSAVYKISSMTVFPRTVRKNQTIYLNITPGTDGTSNYAYFYNQNTYKSGLYLGCSSPCLSPLIKSYLIPMTWTLGNYTAQVYDYTSGKYIVSPFTIY